MKLKNYLLLFALGYMLVGCKDENNIVSESPKIKEIEVTQVSELSKLNSELDKFNKEFEMKNPNKLRGWGSFFRGLWNIVSSDAIGGIDHYLAGNNVSSSVWAGVSSSIKAAQKIDWNVGDIVEANSIKDLTVFSPDITIKGFNDSIKLSNKEIEEIGQLHNEVIIDMLKKDPDVIKKSDSAILNRVINSYNEIMNKKKEANIPSVIAPKYDVEMRQPINLKDYEVPFSTYSNISYSENVLHPERRGQYNKKHLAEDLGYTMESMLESRRIREEMEGRQREFEERNKISASLKEISEISAGHVVTLCNIEKVEDVESYTQEFNNIIEKSDIGEQEKKVLKVFSSVATNSTVLWSKILTEKGE